MVHTVTRLNITWGLLTALSLFVGGYWAGKQQAVATTKIEYRDRVVREMSQAREDKLTITERTIKRVNGDTIVTKSIENVAKVSEASKTLQERSLTETKSRPALLPQYSLGLNYRPTDRVYEVEVGRRLIGPVWGTAAVNQRLEWQLGVRVEF